MNIPTPPLNLESYFYSDVEIKPNKDYEHPEENTFNFSNVLVKCNVKRGTGVNSAGETNEHCIYLHIQVEDGEKRQTPYRIECSVIGTFEPHRQLPEELTEEIIIIQGATLLYSAAREFIMGITSRMMYGPMLIPTISFHGMKKKLPKNDQ